MLILTKKILLTEQVEEEITQTINEHGDKCWRNKEGQFHNEDGPAIDDANGDKSWWLNDRLHRTDGPAIERSDGTKEWYELGRHIKCPIK